MQNCYFPVVAKPVRAASAATDANGKDEQPKDAIRVLLESASRLDQVRKSSDELRAAFMKLGVVSGAAGSAYVEFNRTRVVCSVYGPRNDTRSRREFSNEGQLVCDVKYAPFADHVGRRERGQVPSDTRLVLDMSHLCVAVRIINKPGRMDFFYE